eukprot:scaffold375755_cov99-Cyclotella_meneghiniana.AAC.2
MVSDVVAGATIAGLSNEAELLGAMHISRLLMRSGVSGLASTELKIATAKPSNPDKSLWTGYWQLDKRY